MNIYIIIYLYLFIFPIVYQLKLPLELWGSVHKFIMKIMIIIKIMYIIYIHI